MAEDTITKLEIDEAIVKFHKADELEKSAKELRDKSRAIILKALDTGLIKAGDIEANGKKVSVVVPMSKAKDISFNQDKAEELRGYLEDAYPALLPATEEKTTYTVNLEVLLALMKSVEGGKDLLIAKVEDCLIPATESEPMTPRLKAK